MDLAPFNVIGQNPGSLVNIPQADRIDQGQMGFSGGLPQTRIFETQLPETLNESEHLTQN